MGKKRKDCIYIYIFIYYNEGNTPTMQQIPDLEVNRVQHS